MKIYKKVKKIKSRNNKLENINCDNSSDKEYNR